MTAPILKWAGGKRQLLPEILPRLPAKIETYYEPFIGGGAVFFALASENRFKRAVIADLNTDLINLYAVVQGCVADLIRALGTMSHSEDDFYRVRKSEPTDPIERAARFVYLNRTCFNGLYRVNKSGKFNVPFGRYKNPTICDEAGLRAASEALAGVELINGDFGPTVAEARRGDAVYFDPPYLPVSASSNFAAYQADGFGVADTKRLASLCRRLEANGVAFALSNSDTPATRDVFAGLNVETIAARRNINSKGDKRGQVNEILVVGRDLSRSQGVLFEDTGT